MNVHLVKTDECHSRKNDKKGFAIEKTYNNLFLIYIGRIG